LRRLPALVRGQIRRWLREPLLHFALIGALLFIAYGRMNPAPLADQRIVVTRAVVDDLARQHQDRWQRPASAAELNSLVDAHVHDEILYREGLSLGLERDDPVIRRRVRQKLELMSEEQLARAAPTDAELAAYLARHATRFTRPATVSFVQIFFSGTAPAADVERQIATARTALARGADPARLGQPTMLPGSAEQVSVELIARDFGTAFAAQLATLPEGAWTGPVASALGAHLVKISARTPAALPPLDAVRQQVEREWENERRERSRTESYRQMRGRYDVVIEPTLPQP
jgi:peptidyl-prolyl cis-trans isomerase C